MAKVRPLLTVRGVGQYRTKKSLPNTNQPDAFDVENYMAAPFYSYMFLTSQKKTEEFKEEELQEMLSKQEFANYYVQRFSYDLKLQKASMGAVLLKNTYVHIKNMRKWIWNYHNTSKVIVKHRDTYLPAFKKMLTEFILLNYCAINTAPASGAAYIAESANIPAFNAVNNAYKQEVRNIEYKGVQYRLRHPNPIRGSSKVNFSAYREDMGDQSIVVFMDIYKVDLIFAINNLNVDIFELLTRYLGSLNVIPEEREGVDLDIEAPEVFEPIEAKSVVADFVTDPDILEDIVVERLREEEDPPAGSHSVMLKHAEKKAGKKGAKGYSAPEASIVESRKKDVKADDVAEKTKVFAEQVESMGKADLSVVGDRLADALNPDIASTNLEKLLTKQPDFDQSVLNDARGALQKAILNVGITKDPERAASISASLIFGGLAKKLEGTNTHSTQIKLKKDGTISNTSGYRKKAPFKGLIAAMLVASKRKGELNLTRLYDLV